MIDFGANLSAGSLDLAYRFRQHAAFAMLLVGAARGCNLPDDLASCMLFAFFDAGIACVSADHVLSTVWQFVNMGHVRDAAVTTTLCTSPESSSTPMCALAPK